MAKRNTPLPPDPAANTPLWKRLGWMALIWGASVTFIGVVAYLIRWWINS
ncbi:MAG: DUF2474 domain-containing protein [Pseudomonadota bacterium]